MDEPTLENCPFCDSEYITLVTDGYGNNFAECLDCGACGPYESTPDKARECWNTHAEKGENR